MSVRVMTAVWDLPLPDSEKIVLLALADCANDEGHCWPSMATLAKKCSKSDRTVQSAVKSLVDAGHLTRREVPGKGCNYTVHPRKERTPEAASPPKPTTLTPEAASDKPSRTIKGVTNVTPTGRNAGKHLLPVDWQLPAIADLPKQARACAEQWSAASYAAHGEAFVGYWRSRRGMYSDWVLTWGNRIIALHSQVMRDQKHGNAPPAANDGARTGQFDTPEARAAFIAKLDEQPWARPPEGPPPTTRHIGKAVAIGSLAAQIAGTG